MSIQVINCSEPAVLESYIADWINEHPVKYALICGIFNRQEAGTWSSVFVRDDQLVAAVVQSPQRPIILVSPYASDDEAVRAVITEAQRDGRQFIGVNAPIVWAEAIQETLAVPIKTRRDMALHQLHGDAVLPKQCEGQYRPFQIDEIPQLRTYMWAFHDEACPDDPKPALPDEELQTCLDDFAAWSVDGEIRSFARSARPFAGGHTISAVYTPPQFRARGYAGAVVYGLTKSLIENGSRYVALYTDLANPTANALYKRIGYQRIGDLCGIKW